MNTEKGQYVTNVGTMMTGKAILQLARFREMWNLYYQFGYENNRVTWNFCDSSFIIINATDFADFIA